MKRILFVIAILFVLPIVVLAQKPNAKSQTTTLKATIESIDHDARTVTLKDKDGDSQTLHAGPEVKRFDELKVGDTVTFRYTESVVMKLRKAGQPVTASSTDEPAIVRNTGARPGATITQQQTATVLVKAIDPKAPSVTIQAEDGRTMSLRVENKDLLKNVKAGDRVEISYTEALMISVE